MDSSTYYNETLDKLKRINDQLADALLNNKSEKSYLVFNSKLSDAQKEFIDSVLSTKINSIFYKSKRVFENNQSVENHVQLPSAKL